MNEEKYADIINLPHHVSKSRPRMSNYERAAQFSPFAALKGYGESIENASRFKESFFLSEERAQEIDARLQELKQQEKNRPVVTVTYFEPEEGLVAGQMRVKRGNLLKIDAIRGRLVFEDCSISFSEIVSIEIDSQL